MTIATFSQTAKMMGYESRSTLYRLKRDGLLSDYLIEVNGRDFPGLLHKITLSLADLGLQIQTATVSTYGERVVDVFYVKDIFGLQIQSEVRQQTIRKRLLEIFTDTDESVA